MDVTTQQSCTEQSKSLAVFPACFRSVKAVKAELIPTDHTLTVHACCHYVQRGSADHQAAATCCCSDHMKSGNWLMSAVSAADLKCFPGQNNALNLLLHTRVVLDCALEDMYCIRVQHVGCQNSACLCVLLIAFVKRVPLLPILKKPHKEALNEKTQKTPPESQGWFPQWAHLVQRHLWS